MILSSVGSTNAITSSSVEETTSTTNTPAANLVPNESTASLTSLASNNQPAVVANKAALTQQSTESNEQTPNVPPSTGNKKIFPNPRKPSFLLDF